jgi:hypothetical protein
VVSPPVSSSKPVGGTVKPLFLYEGQNGALCDSNDWYDRDYRTDCKTPKNLKEYEDSKEAENKARNGDTNAKADLEFLDTMIMAGHACAKDARAGGGDAGAARSECKDYVRRMHDSPLYQEMKPHQRLHFWQITQKGLSAGAMGRKDLQEMVLITENCKQNGKALDCRGNKNPRLQNVFAFALPLLALSAGALVDMSLALGAVVAGLGVSQLLLDGTKNGTINISGNVNDEVNAEIEDVAAANTAAGSPNPNDPCDPFSGVGQWVNPAGLQRHYDDHGGEFTYRNTSPSPEAYSAKAGNFFNEARSNPNIQIKVDGTGSDARIRIFDPATNRIGIYDSQGRAISFFRPDRASEYFRNQPGSAPANRNDFFKNGCK